MNTKNNQRRKNSITKIENAFMRLLQEKEVHTISITDICKLANVNRTTFYANYLDIYDLVEKIEDYFVDQYLTKENETVEEAKKRLKAKKLKKHMEG